MYLSGIIAVQHMGMWLQCRSVVTVAVQHIWVCGCSVSQWDICSTTDSINWEQGHAKSNILSAKTRFYDRYYKWRSYQQGLVKKVVQYCKHILYSTFQLNMMKVIAMSFVMLSKIEQFMQNA